MAIFAILHPFGPSKTTAIEPLAPGFSPGPKANKLHTADPPPTAAGQRCASESVVHARLRARVRSASGPTDPSARGAQRAPRAPRRVDGPGRRPGPSTREQRRYLARKASIADIFEGPKGRKWSKSAVLADFDLTVKTVKTHPVSSIKVLNVKFTTAKMAKIAIYGDFGHFGHFGRHGQNPRSFTH